MSELHSHVCFDALATLQNVQNIEEMYCNYCGADHTTTDCPELCKGIHFLNTPQIMDTTSSASASASSGNGTGHPDHSRGSVPAGLHVIDDRSAAGNATASTYVITSQKFAKGSRFGPLLAKKSCVPVERLRFPLVIFGNVGIPDDLDIPELSELFKVRNVYLDTGSHAECNWMVHVTPAAYRNEQNLMAYQQDGHIFFMSIVDIEVGDVLKVWYAPTYAAKMYVPLLQDSPHQIVNNVLQQLTLEQQHQQQHMQHQQQQQQQPQHHQHHQHQQQPPQQHLPHHQQQQQQQHQSLHHLSNGIAANGTPYAHGSDAPHSSVLSYQQQQQQSQAHHANNVVSNNNNNNGPVALPPIQSIIKSSYPKTDYANPSSAPPTIPSANVYPQHPHQQQQQQHHHHQLQPQHHQHHHPQHHHHNHQQHLQPHHHHQQQQQQQQQHHPHQQQSQSHLQSHYPPHHRQHQHPGGMMPSAQTMHGESHRHSSLQAAANSSGAPSPLKPPSSTTTSNSSSTAAVGPFDAARPAATVSLVDDDDPNSGGRSTKKKVYHCEVCDKKYATMTNIYKHMRSHQLYLCSLCMRTFPQEYQIKEHKCPQGSVKTPQCHVCFKYLSNSWSLTRHMKIHAHELDESGNYTKVTTVGGGGGDAGTTVMPQPMEMPRGGTQLAAADSSSGVVRVHEVDISEVTSCSLATSCSSDLLQTSGELSMMSADHSQDYGSDEMQPMHHDAGGVDAVDADTTSMDATESPEGAGDEGTNGPGVECSVCAKRFKSDFRLLKHQRQVHCARIKPPKQLGASQPGSVTALPASVSTSIKSKRPPAASMFPQNLAPPVTPDVAKALASKLNERNPNNQFQQQQQQQQHQQHYQNNAYMSSHQQHQQQQQQQQQQSINRPQLANQVQHSAHSAGRFTVGPMTTFAGQPSLDRSEHFSPPPQPQQQQQMQPQLQQQHQQQHNQQMRHAMEQQHQQQQHQYHHQQQQHGQHLQQPDLNMQPHQFRTMHSDPNARNELTTVPVPMLSADELPMGSSQHGGDSGENSATMDDDGKVGGGATGSGATSAEPFECDVCHKLFQKRNQLTKHRPIHDNTQFVCPYCPNGKSVKAKSTMQKHLRALHEDRIEEWKVPGFVNALLSTVHPKTTSALLSPSLAVANKMHPLSSIDPADPNNNLDRMLGLVTGVDVAGAPCAMLKKRKEPGDGMSSSSKKRYKPLSAGDLSDDLSTTSSSAAQMHQHQHLGGGAGDELSSSMFGRHPSGGAGGAFVLFGTGNGPTPADDGSAAAPPMFHHHTATSAGPQKHQLLERFHQTLDSLEIVDAGGLPGQLQMMGGVGGGVVGGVGGTVSALAAEANGNHGTSDGLMVNGRAASGWTALPNGGAGAIVAAAGVGVVGMDDEEEGAYDHFYEDYMVL